MSLPFLIAIDGPAASGKGTLARRLADYYHLNLLDTGLTYRAVAHALIVHGLPLDNVSAAEMAARQVDLLGLDREVLSAHAVADAASRVAVYPSVRRILVEKQREFATEPLIPPPLITGRDLIALGLPPGPSFSDILEAVQSRQLEGTLRSREEALAYVQTELFPPAPQG